MRTHRRTRDTEATPVVPVSDTKTRKCSAEGKRKCIEGLWDVTIPSDLLQEILSRLGLKANIQASVVCKSWFEAAVSVRNLKPCPWLFSPKIKARLPASPYILVNPLQSQSQTYELDFPELNKCATIFCSKDGWLLARAYGHKSAFIFVNPFTKNSFYLPESTYNNSGTLAFSAAPTSTSCLVISCTHRNSMPYVAISTWRPGQATWTVHRFGNSRRQYHRTWERCVFSNGLFYTLSGCGDLGVFDPYQTTWDTLPVKSSLTVSPLKFRMARLMTEHEGDIFVLHTRNYKRPIMLKLNLEQNVWEEKTDLGGLTVFASLSTTFIRVGLSEEERNRIYPLVTTTYGLHGMYYSLGDGRSSCSSRGTHLYSDVAWVEPPKNLNFL